MSTIYRLIRADQTILEDQEMVWKEFYDSSNSIMEFKNSKGEWKNLYPSDEVCEKLTQDEVIEMCSARGMPVYWWGSRLGCGARPYTLQQVEEAAKTLNLTLHWNEPVRKGDMYLAARNTGAKLLTCAKVDHRGWVQPVEMDYPFDWSECVKVVEKQ